MLFLPLTLLEYYENTLPGLQARKLKFIFFLGKYFKFFNRCAQFRRLLIKISSEIFYCSAKLK